MQGYLRWENAKHYPSGRTELDRFALRLGDVVIALDRPVTKAGLKCSVVSYDDLPSLLVQRVARLRGSERLHQSYLAQLMKSDSLRAHLQGNKTETAVPHVSPNDLRSFKFSAPIRLSEQCCIAEVLEAWDVAIATAEKLLINGQQQRKWLMHKLLRSGKRLNDASGFPCRRASELFAPVSIRRNGEANLLSVTQELGVLPRSALDRKVVMPEGSTEEYKLVEPGNFIISLRSFEGGLEYSRFRGLVSPAYTVLRPSAQICDDFYRHYFKSEEFIGRLAVAVVGIRDGKQISYDDFAYLNLPYPPLEEQRSIATLLNDSESQIKLQSAQVDALKSEKRTLMGDLLTGKRRVRLPEPAVPVAEAA